MGKLLIPTEAISDSTFGVDLEVLKRGGSDLNFELSDVGESGIDEVEFPVIEISETEEGIEIDYQELALRGFPHVMEQVKKVLEHDGFSATHIEGELQDAIHMGDVNNWEIFFVRSESAQGEEIRKAYWRPKVSVLQTRHSKSLRDMVDSFDSIEEARNQFAFEITHVIHEVRPEGEKPNEKAGTEEVQMGVGESSINPQVREEIGAVAGVVSNGDEGIKSTTQVSETPSLKVRKVCKGKDGFTQEPLTEIPNLLVNPSILGANIVLSEEDFILGENFDFENIIASSFQTVFDTIKKKLQDAGISGNQAGKHLLGDKNPKKKNTTPLGNIENWQIIVVEGEEEIIDGKKVKKMTLHFSLESSTFDGTKITKEASDLIEKFGGKEKLFLDLSIGIEIVLEEKVSEKPKTGVIPNTSEIQRQIDEIEITKFVGTPEAYREKIYEEINAVFTSEIIEITSSAGSKAHITLSMYSVNWIDTLSKSKKEKILEAAQRYKVLMSQHFQDATLAPREVIMGSTQILSHAKRRVKGEGEGAKIRMSRNAYYLEAAIIRILQTEGKWQELTEFLFSLSQGSSHFPRDIASFPIKDDVEGFEPYTDKNIPKQFLESYVSEWTVILYLMKRLVLGLKHDVNLGTNAKAIHTLYFETLVILFKQMIPVFNPRLLGIPVSKRIEITRDLANYDEAKFGEHFKNIFTGKMASGMDGISYILALNTQAGEAIIFQLLKEYFTFGISSNTPGYADLLAALEDEKFKRTIKEAALNVSYEDRIPSLIEAKRMVALAVSQGKKI